MEIVDKMLSDILEDVKNVNAIQNGNANAINYSVYSKKDLDRHIESVREKIEKYKMILDEMLDAKKLKP